MMAWRCSCTQDGRGGENPPGADLRLECSQDGGAWPNKSSQLHADTKTTSTASAYKGNGIEEPVSGAAQPPPSARDSTVRQHGHSDAFC